MSASSKTDWLLSKSLEIAQSVGELSTPDPGSSTLTIGFAVLDINTITGDHAHDILHQPLKKWHAGRPGRPPIRRRADR